MAILKKENNLVRILIILTILSISLQVIIVCIATHIFGVLDMVSIAMGTKLFFNKIVFLPLFQFVVAQFILYAFLIYCIWYMTLAIAELYDLGTEATVYLGILIWLNTVIVIVLLNITLVPHSIFTRAILNHLIPSGLNLSYLRFTLLCELIANSILLGLVAFRAVIAFKRRVNVRRHGLMITLLICSSLFLFIDKFLSHSVRNVNVTANRPNIFIIGFDAVRPDFLGFFAANVKGSTPHFDTFLQTATVFNEAYTPIARTMPAWMAILTARYPKDNLVRENNTFIGQYSNDTLPKQLGKLGYKTIYATDDRRFNAIDKIIGFDQIIGPPGTVGDYLIGTINDFPLSNLIVPTAFGKFLFPYNYANHGSTHTYNPNNFLAWINSSLRQYSNHPLFLAVHFNLSGWPFFWFNDGLYTEDYVQSYTHAIQGDDHTFGEFMNILKRNHLLDYAIVILVSDHGLTLGLPGDRIINERSYQGNKLKMKVRRTYYSTVAPVKLHNNEIKKQNSTQFNLQMDKNIKPLFETKNYGIDTSIGYGNDNLSLKQYRTLLAIKTYGIELAKPHQVLGPATLLDIEPTILDLLGIAKNATSEGLSLKPALLDLNLSLSNDRAIFLETAYSIGEIEQRDIVITDIIRKSIMWYWINPYNGEVSVNPDLIALLIKNKQRSVMLSGWLLSYYPLSKRYRMIQDQKTKIMRFKQQLLAPYWVLVNLNNGKWTTEMNNALVASSPFANLENTLFKFYGNEMSVYTLNEKK